MKRLWLDYQQQDPARRRPGIVLLLASLVVSAVLLVHYFAVVAELDVVQIQVARLQREAARQHPLASADSAATTAAGRRDGSGAVTPAAGRWEELFATLEAASDDTVTLLALQPGATELRVSGEAKNLAAALDYVKRLQAAPLFANVLLVQSEVVQENPQHPIRFALLSEWRGVPR